MSYNNTVVFEIKNEGILIEKYGENIVDVFDKIAKSGKPSEIDPHENYEEELEYRWKKLKKSV